MCVAQFEAGVHIGAGLFVLIIPGIYLLIRYLILTPIVIIEGRAGAILRCRDLSRGIMWQLLLIGLLQLLTRTFVSIGFGILFYYMPAGDSFLGMAAADSAGDVVSGLFLAVYFVYFWHARGSAFNSEAQGAPLTPA